MAVVPFVLPYFVARDVNDALLPGAKVYTYAATTLTPLATYSDPMGVTPNTNPVVCDAAGRASIYVTSGVSYKLNLLDGANVQQPNWPIDNVILYAASAFSASQLWPANMLPWEATTIFTASNGAASLPATGFLPAKVIILAMQTLSVLVNFSAANGLTGLSLGDGTIVSRWGSGFGLTTGSVLTTRYGGYPLYTTATDLVLTAEGGTFGATGQLQVVAKGIQFL